MKTLQAFFLHIAAALALLLAFCHVLPRAAFTLAFILQHSQYGLVLLVAAAITRLQLVTWWQGTVMQKAVGAKARHQRALGAR